MKTHYLTQTRWLVVCLFLMTVLTRLPFASQYLYHWDSVNLAFGMRHFDVQAGAPQYPGYIVYVLLGQLVNAFVQNEQTAMVLISIVGSGLAAVAIYILGRELFNPTTGILASVFLITSPLVWFYGEVALPHALDLFAVTFALWLLYRIMQGEVRWLCLTAVFLALLGGVRQQDLLFMGPVILFALWPVGLKRLIVFGAIGAAVSLMWFVPLIQTTGGLQAYMQGSSAYSNLFFSTTSLLHGAGISGLRHNIISKLIPYTLYAWSLTLLPAVIYWGAQIPQRWRRWLRNRKVWFVALSISPALAFYGFIHMGQQGLVFVFMPMLFVLSAEGLRRLLSHPMHLKLATAAISLIGAGIFVIWASRAFLGRSSRRSGIPANLKGRNRAAVTFYNDLLHALSRCGYVRRPEQTPREFAMHVLRIGGERFRCVLDVTDVFERVRYGGGDVSQDQFNQLQTALDHLREQAFVSAAPARES